MCPHIKEINGTDFRKFQTINLDPEGGLQPDPQWLIFNDGKAIRQTENSDPGLAIGNDSFKGVTYEGTFLVDTDKDDDYIGVVFGFKDNSTFYTFMWKKVDQVYWDKTPFEAEAKAGLQLKLVTSITGPGLALRNSLWNTGNTPDQVRLLWSDPQNLAWTQKVSYKWQLFHRPAIGLIRYSVSYVLFKPFTQ